MNFRKVCWYCHQVTMVDKGNFYECSDCGATWNPVPEPLAFGLVIEKDGVKGLTKYRPRKRRVVGVGKKIRR